MFQISGTATVKSTPFCYLCKIFSRVVHKLKYEFQLLLSNTITRYIPRRGKY